MTSSLAIARLLEQVSLRPLPPVRPPPAIMWPAWRPLPCDFVARLAGRRAAERAGDGEAGVAHHRSPSCVGLDRRPGLPERMDCVLDRPHDGGMAASGTLSR